jgi:sulfur carrier protein
VIQIHLNGETREVDGEIGLADLLLRLSLPSRQVAVELNRNVIRRPEWEHTIVRDGDKIEVVHFVGGG